MFDKDLLGFQPFLNHINNQHANIKFTVEESENNILSFFDTRICIKGDKFECCVFRKSTNTDVLFNFSAMRPVAWKRCIILVSLNRGKLICSSPKLFNEEVNNLRWMFQKNGYKRTFLTRFLAHLRKDIAVELH